MLKLSKFWKTVLKMSIGSMTFLLLGVLGGSLVVPTLEYWFSGVAKTGAFPSVWGVSSPFPGTLIYCTNAAPSPTTCVQVPNVDNFYLGFVILAATFFFMLLVLKKKWVF